MLKDLLESNISLSVMYDESLKIAKKYEDEVIINFIAERLTWHQKKRNHPLTDDKYIV
jgi:hypothetical protein